MSIFEALMIIAFGVAWPASIYKSYVSRSNGGKSLMFLVIAFVGYIFGIVHKVFYNYDLVLILYIINTLMIAADIALYYRNSKLMLKERV